jgi:hypothetical protein
MKQPKCIDCHQPMTLTKKFETKRRGRSPLAYGVKRFTCDICGYSETKFGDGNHKIYGNVVDNVAAKAERQRQSENPFDRPIE